MYRSKSRVWGSKKPETTETVLENEEAENPFIQPRYLEIVQNRLYFYSEITRDSSLQLNKALRELHNEILHQSSITEGKPDKILLHISSYGGDIFSGMACVDQILNVKKNVEVVSIVDGCCASAASLISIVTSKRLMNKHSRILIHELSSSFWGRFSEFEDEMTNLTNAMKMIEEIYLQYTKIPEKELKKILKKDLWLNAEQCLEFGLVDEII